MDPRHKKLQYYVDSAFPRCTVLVVGDVMLDQYYFGEVERISPEAPVPVTRVMKETQTLGGAGNVAHNLVRLGCHTLLTGVVGRDSHRDSLLRLLADQGIDTSGLLEADSPTTTKLRIIGGHQQMLRLDFEAIKPLAFQTEEQIKQYITNAGSEAVQCVIISDYGKGVCTPTLCQFIIARCAAVGVPVVIDPKGRDWRKYTGTNYITPNLKELSEAATEQILNEDESVQKIARRIRRRYGLKNIVATRSEKGLSLIGPRRCDHIPTCAREVFDVSGAGDTVIAVLGAALAAGLPGGDAAYLANLAAGVVVGKLGTYAISRQELLYALEELHSSEV